MKHSCDPLGAETGSETQGKTGCNLSLFSVLWFSLGAAVDTSPPCLSSCVARVVTHCWRISRQSFTGNFELGWNQHWGKVEHKCRSTDLLFSTDLQSCCFLLSNVYKSVWILYASAEPETSEMEGLLEVIAWFNCPGTTADILATAVLIFNNSSALSIWCSFLLNVKGTNLWHKVQCVVTKCRTFV